MSFVNKCSQPLILLACFIASNEALASSQAAGAAPPLALYNHWVGYAAIAIFVLAYVLVIFEEQIHMRKSKPVLLAASLIWLLLAVVYQQHGQAELIAPAMRHTFIEYAELFFFLLVAMTYINAMMERGLFDDLRTWLVEKRLSYRQLFWMTGFLAFFISPIADNLTTALILCAVVMSVGAGKADYIAVSCVNIVVAANAGGAFSPFGDITTLMVWQKGIVSFSEFFHLFLPSLVNFIVPALIMSLAVPKGQPDAPKGEVANKKIGGLMVAALFIATIMTTVIFHNFFHIPPAFGMMTGLAYLKLYGFILRRRSKQWSYKVDSTPGSKEDPYDFDVFSKIAMAEWDTLFFFYGVLMAVGGLGFIGYLEIASAFSYGEYGPTFSNILVGVLSALVDNIPVMYAVLSMEPEMSHWQWLLVTLTAGVGGSLLSIGSAAGVALMGQARGQYTFFSHLKWTPAIALGYGLSIWVHYLVNA